MKIGKVNIILTYLPGQSDDQVVNKLFINDLNLISAFENVFIIGDINARHRTWNCAVNNRAGILLHQFLNHNKLFISYPAEHTYCPMSLCMRPSTIDLILTDAATPHCKPWVINEFHSDHLPVRFDITMAVNTKPHQNIPLYHLADWSQFRYELNSLLGPTIDQNSIYTNPEIDTKIEHLSSCILAAKSRTIPTRKPNKDQIVLDEEVISLKKTRNYFRQRFLRNFDPTDRLNYQHFKRLVCSHIREINNKNWEENYQSAQPGTETFTNW